MAVLTELVLANPQEAEAVGKASVPIRQWEGLDAKGHNEITLGTLLAILRGEQITDDTFLDCPCLYEGSQEGPWVYALPQELADAILGLEEARLGDVVNQWCDTEELEELPPDQARDFLRALKALFVAAQERGKSVLMWTSL